MVTDCKEYQMNGRQTKEGKQPNEEEKNVNFPPIRERINTQHRELGAFDNSGKQACLIRAEGPTTRL